MNQKITITSAIAVSCTVSFILGHAWSGNGDPSTANAQNSLTGPRAHHGKLQGSSKAGQSSARRTNRSSSSFAQSAHSAGSILSNSDAVERTKAWASFVGRLDAGSFEETANRLLQAGYSKTRQHEFSMLMSAWAKQDPLAALAYADQQMQGNGVFLHQAALASWAATDPEAAIEYAKNKPSSTYGSPWMLGVIEGLVGTNPARANELLAEMPRSHDRHQALLALQSHYLALGPEAARNWAMSMEDASLRRGAIGQIAQTLAQTDPKGTVDWLMANSGSVSGRTISNVWAEMAKAEPEAATAYISRFECGAATRIQAIEGVSSGLAESDPQAALDYLVANPSPGMVNDIPLMKLAIKTAQTNPEVSATAMDRIQAPMMRTMAESSINNGGGLSAPSGIQYNDFINTFCDADAFGAGTSVRISSQMHDGSIILMSSESAEIPWSSLTLPAPKE